MKSPKAARNAPKPAPWLVYILCCEDGSYYTGITNNLSRRMAAHAAGAGSRYTRSRLPVRLVYVESASSRALAMRREIAIKRMSRLRKDRLIGGGEEDQD